MEYQTVAQLQSVAGIETYPSQAMSRTDRLRLWAEVLERSPERRVATLPRTEYRPVAVRNAMRADGSALWVAYSEPLLRDAGLTGDTYGEARRFFELTDGQLHDIVCGCHTGSSASADYTAACIRALIAPPRPNVLATAWRWLMGRPA